VNYIATTTSLTATYTRSVAQRWVSWCQQGREGFVLPWSAGKEDKAEERVFVNWVCNERLSMLHLGFLWP